MRRLVRKIPLFAGLLVALFPAGAGTVTLSITARSAPVELRPGLVTTAWAYDGIVPGPTIRARVGDRVVVDVSNRLLEETTVHWHGLELPNDQDGPGVSIAPGRTWRYEFTVTRPGTYWYHTHHMPVLGQMDRGLYGAFIVLDPVDSLYSADHVFVLDDWYLDANGRRLPGTARGDMERLGNVETVNGKTGPAVEPLVLRAGELHKLRFINASTAAVHTLKVSNHLFRVTHTDGHPLVEPWVTDTVVLAPGERVDVELEATGKAGDAAAITSDRPGLGMRIPVTYAAGSVPRVTSPFVPPAPRGFAGITERAPDFVLELASQMDKGGMHGMHDMGGMGGGTGTDGGSMMRMMRWTINGESFPDTVPLSVKVGQVVQVRFVNGDTSMIHPMDHPMHLHGTFFQVIALNGERPPRETWKDTITVPAGQYVDVAFVMQNPGAWMLHCHVIDHEDRGLATMVMAE